jgi:hypothetical protein
LGFNFTAYFDGPQITMTNLYGTLKLAPDMATVMIGEFNGDGFDNFRKTSPHPIHDMNNGNVGRMNGYGIIVDVAPKGTGFEAAVMFRTSVDVGNVGADPQDPKDLVNTHDVPTSFIAYNVTDVLLNTDVAVGYTVPNVIKVSVGSTVDGSLAPGYDVVTNKNLVSTPVRGIFGRVEALMVPNLTAWVDVNYTGLEKIQEVDPTPAINGVLAAGYNMDALSLVLGVNVNTSLPKDKDTIIAWDARPEVYYNLGAITAGLFLDVKGSSIKDSTIAFTAEPWVKINDFNTRIAFTVSSSTTNDVVKSSELTWAIPVLIDFGF